jgi:hypothetical protein
MKKLILILLSLVVVSCSHIDEQVTPNKTTSNSILGEWVVDGKIDTRIFKGTTSIYEYKHLNNTDTLYYTQDYKVYKLYEKYNFFSNNTVKITTNYFSPTVDTLTIPYTVNQDTIILHLLYDTHTNQFYKKQFVIDNDKMIWNYTHITDERNRNTELTYFKR